MKSFLALFLFVAALMQGQESAPAHSPMVEVASIKPAAPDARAMLLQPGPGGGIRITNMSLKDMIMIAWRVQPFQMSGGPAWIDSARYDIVAKPEAKISQSEIPAMLQSLLADRFQVRLRSETKEMPVYALVLARKDGKPGPDLMESKEGDCQKFDPAQPPARPEPAAPPPRYCGRLMMGPNRITAIAVPLSSLIPTLSRMLGRQVVDQTGLKGNFDLNVTWTPDETQAFPPRPPGENSAPSDSAAPSFFTAFQERLGLKFESKKGPVEIIVVENAERPSEN